MTKTRNKSSKRSTRRAVSRQSTRRHADGTEHITPPGGNVFLDLGFPAAEAKNLLIRSALMSALCDVIADLTQVSAARLLGVSQPRISDLKRGKIGLFTIDALVNMLAAAGVEVRLSISRTAA